MPRNLEHQIYTELHQLRQRQKTQRSKTVLLILLIAIFFGVSYWIKSQPPATESTVSSNIPTPEPSLTALPLPPSGTITPAAQGENFLGKLRLFLSPPTEADNSKLQAQCPANTSIKNKDFNYFLKVVDWESNQTITTAFIRAGDTVTLNLPAGNYKLRYAAGVQWYGERDWFGTKTLYGEVTDLMTSKPLQLKFENQGTGWDLGLYGCSLGGNTSTKALNPKDF